MSESTSFFHRISWQLVALLVAIGLVWPLCKAIGVAESFTPTAIAAVWMGIRAIWIVIVVVTRDKQPFLTVISASIVYELVAIIAQQINWAESNSGRIPAVVATLLVGIVTGAIIGLIAKLATQLLASNKK